MNPYLARVLTDAEGADVHPGDVVRLPDGAVGVCIGVANERNHPAVVWVRPGVTVRVYRNTEWVRVGKKEGDA